MLRNYILLLGLAALPYFGMAASLDECSEIVDQLKAWQGQTGAIDYKGQNRILKAFADAQNAEVKAIEKEELKISKAKDTFFKNSSLYKDGRMGLDGRPVEINKAILNPKGRNAVIARETIERDDAIKKAERAMNSAKKKRLETQKLAVQDLRRQVRQIKTDDKESKEQLLAQIEDILEALQ